MIKNNENYEKFKVNLRKSLRSLGARRMWNE